MDGRTEGGDDDDDDDAREEMGLRVIALAINEGHPV